MAVALHHMVVAASPIMVVAVSLIQKTTSSRIRKDFAFRRTGGVAVTAVGEIRFVPSRHKGSTLEMEYTGMRKIESSRFDVTAGPGRTVIRARTIHTIGCIRRCEIIS